MKLKYFLISYLLLTACGIKRNDAVNEELKKYRHMHAKYRTLWYRDNDKAMYDSCRKYGLIVDSLLDIIYPREGKGFLDTIPLKNLEK